MRLFGNNTSQASVKRPDVLDVPPELRPYYNNSGQPIRTTSRRPLAMIAVLVIVAVIGLVAWRAWPSIRSVFVAQSHSNSTKSTQIGQNGSSTPPPSGNNTGSGANNTPSPQPTPPATNQPSSAGSGSTPGTTTTPSPSPSPAASPPSNPKSSIPNTGPGSMIVIIPVLFGVIGTMLYYIRQVRLLNQ